MLYGKCCIVHFRISFPESFVPPIDYIISDTRKIFSTFFAEKMESVLDIYGNVCYTNGK